MSELRIVSAKPRKVIPIRKAKQPKFELVEMRPRLTVIGVANALERPCYGPFTIVRRVSS